MTKPTNERSVSASVIVGTLLVPISALAAVWLSGGAADASPQSTPSSTEAVVSTATQVALPDPGAADLEAACGPEGLKLIDLESTGDITDVQQAALDALRPLCIQFGLPLPAAPVPEPLVETVVVQAGTPAVGTTVTTFDDDRDDHDEDDHEDDDHEDEDDHEDDEHESEDDD